MDAGSINDSLFQQPRRSSLDDASTTRPRGPPHDSAGNLEPDTCRICRGEATPQEPLFYPCKCSGSIKYVHQDCLMEWLSHSQKKHCELCKTSFRFTKLYSPTMPKQLPVFVFTQHLAKYFLRNILVWLRVILVLFVWMVFLPILTRWEWSFFFWVSEEGLVTPNRISTGSSGAASAAAAVSVASAAASAATSVSSSPPAMSSSLLSMAASIATSAASSFANVTLSKNQDSHTPPGTFATLGSNATSSPSLLSIVINSFFDMMGMSELGSLGATANGTQAAVVVGTGPPTLLSDVAFLRNLTRFRTLNQLIIYAMEGQFITFLVIVCFILIILVRDYVVQQQPEINMRAAFAADVADVDGDDGAAGVPAAPVGGPLGGNNVARDVNHHDFHDHHHDHNHDDDGDRFGPWDSDLDSDWETDSDSDAEDDMLPDLFAPRDVDTTRFPFEVEQGPPVPDSDDESVASSLPKLISPSPSTRASSPSNSSLPELISPSSSTRASSPTLAPPTAGPTPATAGSSSTYAARENTCTPAAASGAESHSPTLSNLGRNIVLPSEGGASVNEYMRIYRRAGGDPARILEIAREEGLEEHMQYWLRVMQNVVERRQSDRGSTASTMSTASADNFDSDVAQDKASSGTALETESESVGAHENWYDMAQSGSNFLSTASKGKERVDTSHDEVAREGEGGLDSAAQFREFEYGLRPRANTDGPVNPAGINPLGSNSWAFPSAEEIAYAERIRSEARDQFRPRPGYTTDLPTADARESGSAVSSPANPPVDSSTDASADAATPPSTTSSNADANVPGGEANAGVVAQRIDTVVGPTNAPLVNDEPNRQVEVQHHQHQHQPQPQHQHQHPPAGIFGRVANFMWRDLDNIDPADLPPIPAEQDEDAHVALFEQDNDPLPLDEAEREAFEAAAAAAAAANMEAEAIEDAEDLEGVMELLGMRGPIVGLFQNVLFCAFLVTVSLLLGIFLPYNVGRLSIWLLANPMHPVMLLFSLSKLLQDAAATVLGGIAFATVCTLQVPAFLLQLVLGWSGPARYLISWMVTTRSLFLTAATRVGDSFNLDTLFMSTGEIRNFSAISHEALILLKAHVSTAATAAGQCLVSIATGDALTRGGEALDLAKSAGGIAWSLLKGLPAILSNPNSWVITLKSFEPIHVNPEFAYWDGGDRFLAILMGYATVCVEAGWYLHRGFPFSNGQTGQDWEASLIDGLNQASGVLKVILIIGIEMLVFPLYCGLLLDFALLPLFEDTTLTSRLLFSVNYPMTSIFVHWFVGTGYMFHFALFVSMCRKIMRKGVLYFIRDPDDPEFHPVRDVLERSVTTQLRKIMFSAFVYGALVIICLGGVVWGLAYAGPGILPIHYSSNEPVLEFPIDLLFYNFLMPLAIKFFKPSDGLHAMYTWWFRKSARILRITWFLFGERNIDEEGVLALKPDSPYNMFPWFSRQFLEYDEVTKEVVPAVVVPSQFGGFQAVSSRAEVTPANTKYQREKKSSLVASGQLVPDGQFVRAPASDQVKIPKGMPVFLDVTESNVPNEDSATGRNGTDDRGAADDIYNGDQYQLVYIPPNFRARIFLFIASIWIFAAVTGVSFTIIPLLFGRRLFQALLPAGVRTNDVYAFSIGIYVLGSAAYLLFHIRSVARGLYDRLSRTVTAASALNAVQAVARVVLRIAKLAYSYFFILVVFPLLATALVELYVLVPLHTYMYPPGSMAAATGVAPGGDGADGADEARHTVRIVQSWTLGLLYIQLAARTVFTWYPEARLVSAIRALLRRGTLDPDVRLLTRAFVVPSVALALGAIGVPLLLAKVFLACAPAVASDTAVGAVVSFLVSLLPFQLPSMADMRMVYRLSFPFVALAGMAGWSLWGMVGVYASWKVRIRDEAYLIGERLHNFGVPNVSTSGTRRAFRAGAGRA